MRLLKAFAVPFAFALALLASSPALADNNCSGKNSDTPLVTLSARVAGTIVSADQTNCSVRGAIFVVDLTTMTAANVTVTIQGKDAASGKYYTLLAGATASGTGTTILWVYPGVAVTSNVSANTPLPLTWRVSILVANNSGTAAVTGTVGASVLN